MSFKSYKNLLLHFQNSSRSPFTDRISDFLIVGQKLHRRCPQRSLWHFCNCKTKKLILILCSKGIKLIRLGRINAIKCILHFSNHQIEKYQQEIKTLDHALLQHWIILFLLFLHLRVWSYRKVRVEYGSKDFFERQGNWFAWGESMPLRILFQSPIMNLFNLKRK